MYDANHTDTIRTLNDRFRRSGQGGQCFITPGVQELGLLAVFEIRQAVAHFDAFDEANDPYGEHDFGALTYCGHQLFWKIDYYDGELEAGSPNPADETVTTRVLTIMQASEY